VSLEYLPLKLSFSNFLAGFHLGYLPLKLSFSNFLAGFPWIPSAKTFIFTLFSGISLVPSPYVAPFRSRSTSLCDLSLKAVAS
ncbi:MAG: hypothetical protein IKU83_01075, partial [Lachnospiraceae bacterium]|nr:hypothetical protein [Lachnospiraceae bacterium]